MKCYIEITLLPSADIPPCFLWEKSYQQLHLALVEAQDSNGRVNIGVSFPDYDASQHQLGCRFRLFAQSGEELEKLNINRWFARLSDYLHISSIRDVPDKIEGYAVFKRLQPKSNNDRLARRRAKRKGISYEQAKAHFDGRTEQCSEEPFIHIKSQSSDKRYHLIIARIDADSSAQADEGFSTYGLSAKSTVPVFRFNQRSGVAH